MGNSSSSSSTTGQVERITVREFYESAKESLQMEIIAGEEGLNNFIEEKSLNRPALALTGYFKHFANGRLQLFGAGEMAYLRDLREETQAVILEEIMNRKIPGIVISRGLTPTRPMIRVANEFKLPVLRSRLKSKDFTSEATILLEQKFAPRTNLHATLVDVRGIGVLLRGSSGVGKSECALALIERGHSLVADDYVKVHLLGDHGLRGTAKELNRGFMECRGIGIINIASIFGVRSVLLKKSIDLVITFVIWQPGMDEDRTGLENQTFEILGQKVPHIVLPVRPGRDMARLVEVAAMVHALRQTGYDSATEFNERLVKHMSPDQET
ncbi:MAG: HPr(Ser) kinase/phosphatase [Puniceicoccales bacterium]|jgi:HPr kinase/phosphorylase|nr:HPr(Ser) kinase/phosphatase [Puniceicoccales bacterium]